jgi:hypothetical protein
LNRLEPVLTTDHHCAGVPPVSAPIPPLPRAKARRLSAAGCCRPPPPTCRVGAPPHPLRRVARPQARTPTVAPPHRDRFKRGRSRPARAPLRSLPALTAIGARPSVPGAPLSEQRRAARARRVRVMADRDTVGAPPASRG